MAPSVRLSEATARVALALLQQSKMPAVIAAAEEIRHELKRAEMPPSLADYDRMKTPEAERPASMRRSPQGRADGSASRCQCAALVHGKWRADPHCRLCEGSGLPAGAGLRRFIRRKEKVQKRTAKKARASDVRAAVARRADGRCENPDCGRGFASLHWDHFFGKARAESVETTWMLCPSCDRAKTDNVPDALAWVARFLAHLLRHDVAGPEGAPYRQARLKAEKLQDKLATRREQNAQLGRALTSGGSA